MSVRSVSLACPILLLSLVACDRSQLTGPYLEVLTPPAAPYGLWAQGNANFPGTIQLSWTDASSNEDGFKIERCDEIECRVIATTAANASYYVDYPVVPGTTYGYLVRAYNRAGDSAPSGAQGMACDEYGCPSI